MPNRTMGTEQPSLLNVDEGRSTPKYSAREVYTILTEEELIDGFNAHLVVPDVLDKAPPEQLPIICGDGNSIEMGNLITPEDLRYRPLISLERTDPNRFYTLIMTDPDVPNRSMPTEREHLHWLIVNITEQNISKGEEIVPYKSPLPNLGTGLHRYVFVLLEQTRPITIATEAEKAAFIKKSVSEDKNSTNRPQTQSSKSPKPSTKTKESDNGKTSKPSLIGKTGSTDSPKMKDEKRKSIEEVTLIDRNKFSTKEFTKKYAILGVIAANFLQAIQIST
uniref:Phosphatidylethanolamine-binding protein n=1 Tax=Panagrolaimus sp. JU765 TaxID=591449 RepID=A0AC34PXK7_9BILA